MNEKGSWVLRSGADFFFNKCNRVYECCRKTPHEMEYFLA